MRWRLLHDVAYVAVASALSAAAAHWHWAPWWTVVAAMSAGYAFGRFYDSPKRYL